MADPVSTTVTNVTYKVSFGSVLIDTSATEIFDGDNQNTKASVYNIAFSRKVYSPNELIVDLQLSNPTAKTTNSFLKEKFVGKKLSLNVYNDSGLYQSFELNVIREIIPLRMSNTDLYVRLKAYSPDHQLTLRKYCRSYVAKRPFNDILMKTEEDKLWINKYLNTSGFDIKVNSEATLQHLVYGENREECILPYMVQYNESFYDFICRTANRCGEFVYFEKDQLHFGLASDNTESFKDSDCISIYGRKLDHVSDDYFAVEDVNEKWVEEDSASKWNTSWKKGDKAEKIYKSLDDVNKEAEAAAKEEAKKNGKNPDDVKITDEANLKYNFEINEEEHHTKLYKNTFGKFSEFIGLEAGTFWSKLVATVLKQNSLYKILKSLMTSKATEAMNAQSSANSMQLRWEQQLYDKLSVAKSQELPGTGKDAGIAPYVAAKGHATNAFYMEVHNAELEASEMAITFNLGSNYKKIYVGQKIKYDEQDYVIVQIKMNPYTNKVSVFDGIDSEFPKDFGNMGDSHLQVIAVPLINSKVYPPMLPQGHVRHADPQVAFVVDHGYMDPRMQGRIRVNYPWDSKSTISPWMRVMVPGGTKGGGYYAEAGEGDEVLVCYFGGNVERPYIGGFLRNRERTLAYRKGDMYMVSKNFHSIGFDDPVDPTLFFQGLSPMLKTVKSFTSMIPRINTSFLSGGYDTESTDSKALQNMMALSGGITLSDKFGMYKISMSSDQRKVDISSPFGNVGISAFTGITISAPNGDIAIKGKNVSIEAANNLKIESGKNVKDGFFDPFIKDGIAATLMKLSVEAATELIVDLVKPLDLQLVRCVIEMGLHPVSGTLQIKSHNYLLLEAGTGTAKIPTECYRKSSRKYKNTLGDDQKAAGNNEKALKLINISFPKAIEKTVLLVGRAFSSYALLEDNVISKAAKYETAKNNAILDHICGQKQPIGEGEILEKIWGKNYQALTAYEANYLEGGADHGKLNIVQQQVNHPSAYSLITAATELAVNATLLFRQVKGVSDASTYEELKKEPEMNNDLDYQTYFYDELKKVIVKVMADFSKEEPVKGQKWSLLQVNPNTFRTQRVIFIRRIIFGLFAAVKEELGFVNDVDYKPKKDNWFEFVTSIRRDESKSVGSMISDAIAKPYTDLAKDLIEQDIWDGTKRGQILFSDSRTKAYYFDKNGNYKDYKTAADDNAVTLKSYLRDVH